MNTRTIVQVGAAILPGLCSLVSLRFGGDVLLGELSLGGLLYGTYWGYQNGDAISEYVAKKLLRDEGTGSLGIYLIIKFLSIPSCMVMGAAVGFVSPLALAYVLFQ